MLETPKSAKTPSTFGIPDSRTASAILENGDKTQLTFDPNLVKRSRAIRSACSSRSRLINLPEESLSAMASECPPAPNVASTYIPSGFIRSHSSTSCNITGVCGRLNSIIYRVAAALCRCSPSRRSNPQIFQRLKVVFRERIVLDVVEHSGVVHDFQIIQFAEHIHITLGLRRFPQHWRQQNSSLPIHFHHLPEIARSHQKLALGLVLAGNLRQLFFNRDPHLHRINPRRFPGRAGDIELTSVLP